MKIANNNNIKNKTPNVQSRLLIGLSIITLITLVLAFSYYNDVRRIDKRINTILAQSFVINKSISLIESNINSIQLSLKDVVLAKNKEEQNEAIQRISGFETIVVNQFEILTEKFEGDPKDVLSAYNSYKNWKPIRDEVLVLVEKNEIEQAAEITREKGAKHVKFLLEKTKILDDIADIKANETYTQTLKITKAVNRKTILFSVFAIVLGALTVIWIVSAINRALDKITSRICNLSKEDVLSNLPEKTNNKFVVLNFVLQQLEERKIKLELSIQKNRRELYQAKNLLENAIENASVGMVMLSLDYKFDRVNKAFTQLIGYSKEELKNITFNEITHEEDRIIGNDFIKKALAGESELTTFQKRYIHKNGNIVYASISSALIKDEQNNPLYFFTQIRDISQQKSFETELIKHKTNLENEAISRAKMIEEKTRKLEKSQMALSYLLEDVNDIRQELEISNIKLTAANKELEAFSYSVSHDLKAPLRAIDGFSNILIEDHSKSLDDEGIRVLRVIIDNANKMRLLIDDILELSRLGRKQVVFSEINLNLMIKDIILDFKPITKNRLIKWKISKVPNIVGDKVLLKQLLINLISNAVKFTSKNDEARIEIGSKSEGKENIFFIKDNGVGFEMKYVEKVFEVFQRLHLATEFEGTGIGLAIVKRIVEKHNGKIWIESKLNAGTQIYFTI